MTVTEGDPLTINCEPVVSVPVPTFSWELAKTPTDESPTALFMNERLSMDDKGALLSVAPL